MSSVIKVEHLSKKYKLGTVSSSTLAEEFNDLWGKLKGRKEEEIDFYDNPSKGKIHWALKNIDFEVKQGEVLGVIGKNGAGKSTLLKILSKVTSPTTGSVKMRGRIASLLEVGTGFQGELSGKENIFLNGAILGMSRGEIKKKYDEIIDFSGVEKFIDTPVKRYSSGMYVRLAFAVAAHLDPDILIVDEVLAVGDAEFQKKCMGKMQEANSKDGRTILFVSHNIAAIKRLCSRGILLSHGNMILDGNIGEVVEAYIKTGISTTNFQTWVKPEEAPGNEKISIKRVAAYPKGKTINDPIKSNEAIVVEMEFENKIDNVDLDVTWDMFDADLAHVFHVGTIIGNGKKINKGVYSVAFEIPENLLNNTRYSFSVLFGIDQRHVAYRHENLLAIDVEDGIGREGNSFHKYPGVIHPAIKWDVKIINEHQQRTFRE